jgi:hypothetical protein
MPALDLPITAQGALVNVYVGVSLPRAEALKKLGQSAPALVPGIFLIDTGASGTCLDSALLRQLGIHPSGCVDVQTPTTQGVPHVCEQYDVSIYIPGADPSKGGLYVPALAVLDTPLSTQGIDGLIGRDVLSQCVLIYNAGLKVCTLAY